jgi:hypothetical protein
LEPLRDGFLSTLRIVDVFDILTLDFSVDLDLDVDLLFSASKDECADTFPTSSTIASTEAFVFVGVLV